jgi:phage terminase large subunit-like protein
MGEEPALNRRGQSRAGLKEMLETIRECATHALQQLVTETPNRSGDEEVKALRWQCTNCGQTKNFTRKVPAEVAPPCPKCRGTTFIPL